MAFRVIWDTIFLVARWFCVSISKRIAKCETDQMQTYNFSVNKEMTEIDDDYNYASSDFENDSDEIEEDIEEEDEEEEEDEDGTDLQHNSLPRDSVEPSRTDDPDFIRSIGVEVRSVQTPHDDQQEEEVVTCGEQVEELSYTDPEVMLVKLQSSSLDGDFGM